MMCPDLETLSEVLDERRQPEEARAVREHVFACSGCHERWTQLEQGRAAMHELAWQEPPPSLRRRSLEPEPGARPTSLVPRWAAATAIAVALALVWVWSPWKNGAPPSPTPDPATDRALAKVSAAEAAYRDAIVELETRVQSQQANWPPELQATFDENMALIDGAIDETRAVAAQHADHPDAQQFMLAAYQEKVDLLSDAATWEF